MVRVGLSVEGSTEERFVKLVLAPHLSPMGVFIYPVSIGGNISIERIRGEIERLSYSFDYVGTFYDFYGFKKKNNGETKETLEQRMLEAIKTELRQKFFPYIQMYEFEGLLFCSPTVIAANLHDANLCQWAENILQEFGGNPESINNSRETAPSKRLEQNSIYRKTTHGPNIAKEIGIEEIRNRCAGFNEWLNKIEGLAA
jgi:hypothetical protein